MTTITPRSAVLAGAAIAAPVLLLGSTLAYIAGDGLGDDPLGGTIQVYAAIGFGLALLGLTARLEPHLPRLAAALTVTGMVGVAGAIGFGHDSIVFSYNPVAALSEQEAGWTFLSLLLPGIIFPLTLAATGLAAMKTGIGPRWAGALLAIGGLCFPVSRIGEIAALAVVADAFIAAGLVPMGLSGLRSHSAQRRTLKSRPDQVLA